jgi:uncharacterized protein YhaN
LRSGVDGSAHSALASPLVKARENVARLSAELAASRKLQVTLEAEAAEERRLTDELADLEHQIDILDSSRSWRELKDVDDKLRRLTEIEDAIATTEMQLRDLVDVAHLTNGSLEQVAKALDEVERLRQEIARADEQVAREREDHELACREVVRIDYQLANLPAAADVPRDRLASAENAVAKWREADRQVHEAEEAVETLRARLTAMPSDDPALHGVPKNATVDLIDVALRRAEAAAIRVQEAESEAEKSSIAPEIEDEYDALDRMLGDLTVDRLDELQQCEHQIHLTETARRSRSASTVPLTGLVMALIGLSVGWIILKLPGAVTGALVLGAIGYVLARVVYASQDRATEEIVTKNQKILADEIIRRGTSSVADLRRGWNRRTEIAGAVRNARDDREKLRARREELERALDDLERVTGTRDVSQARSSREALERGVRDVDSQLTRLREAEARVESARATAVDWKQAARTALSALNLGAEEPLHASALLDNLHESQLRRANLLRRKAEVEITIRAFLEHEKTRDVLAESLATAKDLADSQLVAIGISATEDNWMQAFQRQCERFIAYQDALGKYHSQRTAREVLVGGDDPNEWRRRYEALRNRIDGADHEDTRTREELESQRSVLSARREHAKAQLAALLARRQADLEHVREPAQIEEELAQAERDYTQLVRLKSAFEDARDLLATVAENYCRDFAPRLADGLAHSLDLVTAGRYTEVEVDPSSLMVKVKSAERGDLVEIESLGQGTRDAVNLLLRTSVVELLSGANEPVPLFLDDPLVHVDAERTRRLLDVLRWLADERQIFYFTQDQRVAEWAKGRPDVRIHELGT